MTMIPRSRLFQSAITTHYLRRQKIKGMIFLITGTVLAWFAFIFIAGSSAHARGYRQHQTYNRSHTIITCDRFGCRVEAKVVSYIHKNIQREAKHTRIERVARLEVNGNHDLVSEARRYIGTNPTGRGRLWCGAFMDFVLKRTGHVGGGNLALAYKHYGTRIQGPQIGAIAVMGRRGGGHVGVVSGIDANGNPIIISGNTWNRGSGGRHTVLEQVYPRSRIEAYVIPSG